MAKQSPRAAWLAMIVSSRPLRYDQQQEFAASLFSTARMEVIEFLCPNGHRIHCPEEQAGRAARCPRCGVKFRIPDPSEVAGADLGDSGSGVSRPELTDSGVSEASAGVRRRPPSDEPQIEFLCPNGHRLFGPARLQGRPGQCPECGSRFRIPTYEDVSDEEGVESGIGLSGGNPPGFPSGEAANAAPDGRLPEIDEIQPHREREKATQRAAAERGDVGHPLARLFSRLWAEKPPGSTVELRLAGGQTIGPDQFAEELSQESHGVFAVREPDGAHTLTVVAWDSIDRVFLRGVRELPEEMSD